MTNRPSYTISLEDTTRTYDANSNTAPDHYYPFGLPMGCGYNTSFQKWRFGGIPTQFYGVGIRYAPMP